MTAAPIDEPKRTRAFVARSYLTGLGAAFDDGNRPALDTDQLGATEFPSEFARLSKQWEKCLDAAAVVNQRYYNDWNQSGGPLTVIAPATRDKALSELRGVWNILCRSYIDETLDRDRIPWDCRFCGEHVGPDDRYTLGGWERCPECLCLLTFNGDETDWA